MILLPNTQWKENELGRLFFAFAMVLYYSIKLVFILSTLLFIVGISIGIIFSYQTLGKPLFILGTLIAISVLGVLTCLVYLYLWIEEVLDGYQ